MRLNTTKRLYIGFSFALLLIIVIGVTSYKTYSKQAEEEKWIIHTYEVINVIDNIQINVYEMRFAARSFLYTNDSAFLRKYEKESANIATQFISLEGLVNDSPSQVNRLIVLKNEISDLSEYLENTFAKYKTTTRQDIVNITTSMQPELDSIHTQFAGITSEENKLLVDREAKNQALVGDAVNVLILDISLILLLVGILIYFILSE